MEYSGVSKVLSGVFLAGTLAACQSQVPGAAGFAQLSAEQQQMYVEVESFRKEIFGHLDPADIPDTATVKKYLAQGVVNSINEPYTHLLVQDDSIKNRQESLSGEAAALGFDMELFGERLYWRSTLLKEDSPAAKAGLLNGDIVMRINDTNLLETVDLKRIQKLFTSFRAGSAISMTVFRPADTQKHELSFTLESEKAHVVTTRMVEGDYGMLSYSQFIKGSEQDFRAGVEELLAHSSLKGLVIDLRGNPGGSTEAARGIAELFLPKGSIVYIQKTRATQKETVFRTEADPLVPATLPVVVLVNSASASCSEIVAGALQAYKRAKVVGTTTYGKGIAQSSGSRAEGYLEITDFDWYVSDGSEDAQGQYKKMYIGDADENRIGLTPDIRVVPTEEEIVGQDQEVILDRALDELQR